MLAWLSALTGVGGSGALIWGALSRHAAGERRPARRLGALALLWAVTCSAAVFLPPAGVAIGALLVLGACAWLFPRKHTAAGPLPSPERYDERDSVFSRMAYRPGSEAHRDYYLRNPGRLEPDDRLRRMPGLAVQDTPAYDSLAAVLMHSSFELTAEMHRMVKARAADVACSVEDPVDAVRTAARHWGACTVGFAPVVEGDVYSFVGRRTNEYGQKICLDHESAVVYGVQMRYSAVAAAPSLASTAESARAYLEAAVIGLGLVRVIRRLGWSARAHIDGNYLVAAPSLAARAGLGEIGRSGLLVTEQWGPRLRLGVVTTDMPLPHDGPITFGLEAFCRVCGRCADGCPARAIERGTNPAVHRGVRKWTADGERCYRYWRTVGSDCGLCLKTCPYSRPDAGPYRAARRLVRRRPLAARAAVALYDFVFARAPGARLRGVDAPDALIRRH